MLDIFEGFDGTMSQASRGATLYNYWQYFLYTSMLREQTDLGSLGKNRKVSVEYEHSDDKNSKLWTTENRLTLFDNYGFNEFYRRMILQLSDVMKRGDTPDPYDHLCRRGFDHSTYSGS